MLKKVFLLIFIAVILCGCKTNNVEKEIINFSSWGSITEVSILKKLISEYENENPNIKIRFLHIPQNYFQKLHLLFASNTTPDVIFINNLNLPIYEKYLEDLTDYIDKNDFYPVSLSGLSYNKKLLAIPRDISNLVFYVNIDKTILPQSNWKIKDLVNSDYKISFEDDIYWATPYLSYFGEVDLTDGISEEEKKGIFFYKSLRDEYKIAPTKSQIGSSTLAQMFLDEKILFYLSGRWIYPKIEEKASFNWAVINFPYGNSNQLCDTSGWAVTKKSKNKAEAIKFAKFLASEKSSEYFVKTGLIIPARIKASLLLDNNKHNEKAFLDAIKHSKATVTNKNYKKITDAINLKYFE